MTDHLVFPSNVMEHLKEDQIELLYNRYLQRELSSELLKELSVKCHVSHIISHFPYVEAETDHKCSICSNKIYTKRKNVVGNSVDWGLCGECGHKQQLICGQSLPKCECQACEDLRSEKIRQELERNQMIEEAFWTDFRDNNRISADESPTLEDVSVNDLYTTYLLMKVGCFDENGVLDPVTEIQRKHLIFPSLKPFLEYVDRMCTTSAFSYAWTDHTKYVLLKAHSLSEQTAYLNDGSYWPCYDNVHLRLTINTQDEQCDCDTEELMDICGANGCQKARFMTPQEFCKEVRHFVAPPGAPCVNSERVFWKAIQEFQLIQVLDFLQATERQVAYSITPDEMPGIKEAICVALKRYSPAQCAYLVSKALKDAVVFSRSEGCKGRAHACRTIRHNITRLMEKAEIEGWVPSSYSRMKFAVVPKVTQNFYSEILGFTEPNDPSWYLSVKDIQDKFPSNTNPLPKQAQSLPAKDDEKVVTCSIPKLSCQHCNNQGQMEIAIKDNRLGLFCKSCNKLFKYKLVEGHQPLDATDK